MSLQGTLDTFSLAEILGLIERTHKTGALEVRDPQPVGILYFAGGRFSAAESGDLTGGTESQEELDGRLVDVCFNLFRVENGAFEFDAARFPPWPVRGGTDIAPVVHQVAQILLEWRAFEEIIPSLDCRPDLVPDLGDDEMVLTKMGFRLLRLVDGERSIRDLARQTGKSVLDVCRALKDLIDAGAVAIPGAPAPREVVLHDTSGDDDGAPGDVDDDGELDELAMARAAEEAGSVIDTTKAFDVPKRRKGAAAAADGAAAAELEPTGEDDLDGALEASASLDAPPTRGGTATKTEPRSRKRARNARQAARANDPAVEDETEPEPLPRRERRPAEEVAPAAAAARANEPAPDRGALLRLFSALRDS